MFDIRVVVQVYVYEPFHIYSGEMEVYTSTYVHVCIVPLETVCLPPPPLKINIACMWGISVLLIESSSTFVNFSGNLTISIK